MPFDCVLSAGCLILFVPEVAIYSVIYSLVEGTGAGSVQIMVNGEKNASYQEPVDLSQPLDRDLFWEEEKEEG